MKGLEAGGVEVNVFLLSMFAEDMGANIEVIGLVLLVCFTVRGEFELLECVGEIEEEEANDEVDGGAEPADAIVEDAIFTTGLTGCV